VEQFSKEGHLEEKTEFGNGFFTYALQSKDGIKELEAGYADGTVTMYVPADLSKTWAANEIVGYSNSMDIGNGKQLALLLEKDFKCIDNSMNEDQSDAYENPTHSCE
jgi:hypothetical protein